MTAEMPEQGSTRLVRSSAGRLPKPCGAMASAEQHGGHVGRVLGETQRVQPGCYLPNTDLICLLGCAHSQPQPSVRDRHHDACRASSDDSLRQSVYSIRLHHLCCRIFLLGRRGTNFLWEIIPKVVWHHFPLGRGSTLLMQSR